MKFIIYLITFFTCINLSKAQENEKISNLKTPSSPAASVLNIVPGSVLQPKSYQALEAAVYSNFLSDNKLTLPENFSLEFSPYWFKDHGLDLKSYLIKTSFIDQLKRNSAFSLASTQSYYLGDSTKTNSLAFGYRTSFYFKSKKDEEKITYLLKSIYEHDSFITELTALAAEILLLKPSDAKSFMDKYEVLLQNKLNENQVYKGVTEQFISLIRVRIEKLQGVDFNQIKVFGVINQSAKEYFKMDEDTKELKEYINNRYGFHLDIAYANFLNFPTNDFEYSIVPKQSIWLTPSYRFYGDLKNLKLIGVLRYQWNMVDYFTRYFPNNKLYKNNLDYGMALNGNFDRFSAYIEFVGRKSITDIAAGTDDNNSPLFRREKDSDLQYLGTISYRLTEQIVLSYSLGKNFQILNTKGNNLISLLSLNFGFGAPTLAKKNIDK